MKNKHVWIIEYNWDNGWGQSPNNDGYFITYNTKRNANLDLINHEYLGHPKDLRIRKYVREER